MKQTFAISDVVKKSWEALKGQLVVLVGLYIGYIILSGILSAITSGSVFMGLIGSLLSLVIAGIFSMGYFKNIFQTLDGIEPQFSAYGQQASKFFTYLGAAIIVGLAVMIGSILLIIPGIYLALRLQFFICFIVEEDAGITESIKRSWAITEGHVMNLFLLALAQIGIAIVGLLLLGIGILVAAPLINVIQCYVFRVLNNPLDVAGEIAQDIAEQEIDDDIVRNIAD